MSTPRKEFIMESRTRLYKIWENMKQRCYNPHHQAYNRYGGRGITICNEWKTNYQAFKEWALSHGYDVHLTIDRIDNDKGYCPDNCRWITIQEQQKNRRIRRDAIWVIVNGERMTLKQAAEVTGQKYCTLLKRAKREKKGTITRSEYLQKAKERREAVIKAVQENPTLSTRKIAAITGVNRTTVQRIKASMKKELNKEGR